MAADNQTMTQERKAPSIELQNRHGWSMMAVDVAAEGWSEIPTSAIAIKPPCYVLIAQVQ